MLHHHDGPRINPELRPDGSLPYPTRQVLSAFQDPAAADAALQQLNEVGVALNTVMLFTGEDGAARWRTTAAGASHGWITRLFRTFGDEQEAMRFYEQAVCSGGCVLAAAAGSSDEKRRIGEVIKANGGDLVRYYGRGTVENL